MMLEWTEEDIYLVAQYAYELHLEGYNYDAAVIFEGLLAINPDNNGTAKRWVFSFIAFAGFYDRSVPEERC